MSLIACSNEVAVEIDFAINGQIIPISNSESHPALTSTEMYVSINPNQDIFVHDLTDSKKPIKNRVWHIENKKQVFDSVTFSFFPSDYGFQKIGLCHGKKNCIYKWIYIENDEMVSNNFDDVKTIEDTIETNEEEVESTTPNNTLSINKPIENPINPSVNNDNDVDNTNDVEVINVTNNKSNRDTELTSKNKNTRINNNSIKIDLNASLPKNNSVINKKKTQIKKMQKIEEIEAVKKVKKKKINKQKVLKTEESVEIKIKNESKKHRNEVSKYNIYKKEGRIGWRLKKICRDQTVIKGKTIKYSIIPRLDLVLDKFYIRAINDGKIDITLTNTETNETASIKGIKVAESETFGYKIDLTPLNTILFKNHNYLLSISLKGNLSLLNNGVCRKPRYTSFKIRLSSLTEESVICDLKFKY